MSGVAVVVIDMLNPYDHEDADALAKHAGQIVEPLAALIERASNDDDVQLVYVNDNYGDFTATRETIIEAARRGRHPELVEPIVPPRGVAFLQKVRHSAFYSTSLEYLLAQGEIRKLVLTGQVTEQCILYTALDAYIRHFEIRVPRDAVATIDPELGEAALKMMERNMRVELTDVTSCLAAD